MESASAVAGVALGIDWRLYSLPPTPNGTLSIMLSTGVRRLYATLTEHPATSDREGLAMWSPFIGVGLSFDGRFESRSRPRPSPRQSEPKPETIEVQGVQGSEPARPQR